MGTPLNPDDMQSLLTHDRRYQRASAILTDQWQRIIADEDLAYRQQLSIEPAIGHVVNLNLEDE
ncbi:hypothetical protein WP50_02665 [Lactiplantibacillus plantarum]|nr:hypothetical protein WP50_02665 [Lactiplantibacillus plantarum]